MSTLTKNLIILWRSERLLAEAEWRRASRQITILVLAGLMGLLALIMLNVAAFYWLSTGLGNAEAALAVAIANLVLAALLVLSAQSLKSAPETEMVREFRNSAMADIESEAEAIQKHLNEIRGEVQSIGSMVAKFSSGSVSAMSPALLISAITALTSVLKSSKAPPATAPTAKTDG